MEKIISHDIYSHESNDFFGFYSKIVSSTKFKRLPNSDVENYLIENKLEKANIIYQNNTMTIIYSNPTLDTFTNCMYMISDPNDVHRYFWGIMDTGAYTSVKIFGQFVYFNLDGNVTQLIVIPTQVLNYDWRNGRIDKSNTFLYNQSLVFIQSHRDTRKYMITICCFNYYDGYLGAYTEHTEIKSKYFSFDRYIRQYNRFLIIQDDETNICYAIDLGSTSVEKKLEPNITVFRTNFKPDLMLTYKMYKLENIDNIENIQSQLSTLNSNPEKKYSDDYIGNCIKCSNLTSSAVFYEGNMSLGLGKSYCHDCGIRYSLSDSKWVCAKLAPKTQSNMYTRFCCNELTQDSNYICGLNHDDSELEFKYSFVEKKPYKKDGSVTIVKPNVKPNYSDEYDELDNLSD